MGGIAAQSPDGSLAWLGSAPSQNRVLMAVGSDTAGDTIWKIIFDQAPIFSPEQRPVLSVSRDRGRSWREVPLPDDEIKVSDIVRFETRDGRTAYLTAGKRLWRTTDDGEHWQSITPPEPTVPAEMAGTYLLPAGSDRFVRPADRRQVFVRQAGARLLSGGGSGAPYTSADCRVWTPIGS
jgi:hypothetical protein